MTSEVSELYNIAVSILQTSNVNVIIDNTLETAMTDYKNIYVTINLIPPELRKYKRVVSRVFDGQVTHEAGHFPITFPIKKNLVEWIQHQNDTGLANSVHQAIEDKRVNHYVFQRYRFDFAHRLKLLADVSNRLWIDSLRLELAKIRNSSPVLALKPEEELVERIILSIATLKGLWGVDVEHEFRMTEDQKEFLRKTAEIFDNARFDRMITSVLHRTQELYMLWKQRIQEKQYDGNKPRTTEYFPGSLGGTLKLQSGQQTKKAIAKIEKELQKAEEKAKAEEAKEGKGKDKGDTIAVGSGSGLSIPTPTPNEGEYFKLTERNHEHVERLLNLLKRLAKPKLEIDKWQRQGRFMNEILGKAFASSNRRSIQEVYARRTIKLEKTEACIGLLVDLSGSVSEEDAKDSLTTIAEVCGRWLRDEDFAIMVFGSEYQKIKAYVEPYHTTRTRIGGVKCLGGTELYSPLNELFKMMKAQRNNRAKILIIVSDFFVDKPEECKKLIKTIEQEGVSIIGLGIDNTTESHIKQFCQKAKCIGSIRELPESLFDLYREVAF